MRAVARALVTDPNDADDVEQQTWLAALARPPRHAESLRGWLGAAARNAARKLGRSRTRRLRHEGAAPAREDAAPAADLVAEAEVQQRIGRAVLALDEPFRSTVLLRYFDGLPPAGVAARLGVPVETVRSRLRRAHERLRDRLDEESGGDRAAWATAVLAWESTRRSAQSAAAAIPASVVAAGGVAMSLTKKLLVAAALLAAVGTTTWFVAEGISDPAGARSADLAADAPPNGELSRAAPRQRAERPPLGDAVGGAADARDLPPPVDLDAADRDLDLHGTVVDAAGLPVAGADVATVTYPFRAAGINFHRDRDVAVAGGATRSARDGTFLLRLARGDSVGLRVAAAGFAAVEVPSVAAGERVRVTLRPGVRLVLALTDAAGAPLANGGVRAFGEADGVSFLAEGATGADGVCAFDRLPPSAEVLVDHPGNNGRYLRLTLPATGEMRHEIRVAAGRTIRGTVIDAESRRPVEGALVGIGHRFHAPTTTGPDGAFALTGWTGEGAGEVQVRADGYATDGREVRDATVLDFELRRGYATGGRVVDESGLPVAGALVSVLWADWASGVQWVSEGHATSGRDGRFRVAGLRPGMLHVISVLAPGHGTVRREAPLATSADEQDLGDVVVPRPQRVEGVVVEGDGRPSRRVPVALSGAASGDRIWAFYGPYASVVTDDLGRFRFSGVAPGAYALQVRPAGAHEIRADVSVTPGRDVLDLRIVRASTRKLRIRVTDAGGAPVAGADVRISGSSDAGIDAQANGEGIAHVEVPSAVRLHYTATGPWGSKRWFMPAPWREIPDAATDVTIVLDDAARFAGRIVDPDDAPVPGARLKLVAASAQEWTLQAGDDGRFDGLVPLAGRTSLTFDGTAVRDGRSVDTGLAARVERIEAGADVVVRCTRVASDRTLTVVVTSPRGEPLEGAVVTAAWGDGTPARQASTDAAGRASLDALPAREVVVAARTESNVFLRPERVTVVPAGQELRLVCRAASRITGLLTDDAARPVAGVHVEALRDGRQVGLAVTDAEGTFALLLPIGDTASVQLYVDRNRDDTPDVVRDGVAPGTADVRLVIGGATPR